MHVLHAADTEEGVRGGKVLGLERRLLVCKVDMAGRKFKGLETSNLASLWVFGAEADKDGEPLFGFALTRDK